jgi:dynein light chain LC8-type
MAEKHDTHTSSSLDIGQAPPKDPSLTGTSPKAIIKNVDMSEEMQQDSVDIASAALEKYNIEKDIAAQIKKEFDRKHGPTWHVVVGKNFGSYVTHGMLISPSGDSGSSYTPVLRRVSMSIIWKYLRHKYLF